MYSGLALVVVALALPFDVERRFDGHMAQHLLVGDLAPLLVVLGLDGRILRPLLQFRAVRALKLLAHPLVALPLWAVNLCVWHTPALYVAALRHDIVHALEHGMFFACGALMWAAVVEPLPGPRWFTTGWKAVYVLAVRVVGGALATAFLFAGRPVYSVYGLDDQRIGGGIMLTEGGVVTLIAFAWLFLRWTRETELSQSLLDRGVDPARAERAGRYGTASASAISRSPSTRSLS